MISHDHRTLFVHIPKCGGQSVEHAFLNDLGLSWANRAPLLLRPRAEGEQAPPRLAHLSLSDYVRNHYLSQRLYEEYYRFAIIRCPYRRVISFYNYFALSDRKDLNAFVREDLTAVLQPRHEMYWFFKPQVDFLTDESGDIGVHAAFQLESLDRDWEAIREHTGLAEPTPPRVNVSRNTGQVTAESLTPEARAIIRELYDADFLSFPEYDTP